MNPTAKSYTWAAVCLFLLYLIIAEGPRLWTDGMVNYEKRMQEVRAMDDARNGPESLDMVITTDWSTNLIRYLKIGRGKEFGWNPLNSPGVHFQTRENGRGIKSLGPDTVTNHVGPGVYSFEIRVNPLKHEPWQTGWIQINK